MCAKNEKKFRTVIAITFLPPSAVLLGFTLFPPMLSMMGLLSRKAALEIMFEYSGTVAIIDGLWVLAWMPLLLLVAWKLDKEKRNRS